MHSEYVENGYFLIENLFDPNEVAEICSVVTEFHEAWKFENNKFYLNEAVNSAYLTDTKYLSKRSRIKLFKFIGSHKLMNVVLSTPLRHAAFMNTQLFFDPINPNQKNYWHRDPQYHLSVEEQEQALDGPEVIHFRIPLYDEPGIELIPGTHKRWDTEEELHIRLEKSESNNSQHISTGVTIPLSKGDLLVFSGNMIHRGLYGRNRLALDILFCERVPELVQFVRNGCLPDQETLNILQNTTAFENTIKVKSDGHAKPT